MINNVIRGDTRVIEVTWKKSDGTAYDLTGATVNFTVHNSSNPSESDTPVISKEVSQHDNNVTTITLAPGDTDVNPGTYWYDVQLEDSGGNILSKKRDRFEVVPDITR